MSYCNDHPVDIVNNEEEIKIIVSDISVEEADISVEEADLPKGFKFKTLGLRYLDEIYGLINNHYVEDANTIIRLTYSKDFIYWYLKYIPDEFIIGLMSKKKLVGLITALFIDMVIYGKKVKVPYINFLCLQPKIRNVGLAPIMINEMKNRLTNKVSYALFHASKPVTHTNYFCTTKDFVVPINYQKLREVGFLTDDLQPLSKPNTNPLHLMIVSDIKIIVSKLNNFLEKFKIRPYFTDNTVNHFLLPKKNIVYSFVKKDSDNEITDFISVYKNYIYCLDHNKLISVAQLAFYFNETMSLTELVINLIDKLSLYNFDQLTFRNIAENMDINITKFATYDQLYHILYNLNIKDTCPSQLCIYPF